MVAGPRNQTPNKNSRLTRIARIRDAACRVPFSSHLRSLVHRGIFIEQNSYHSRVGSAFLLGNVLRVSIQGALNRRMPQQFSLHLEVSPRGAAGFVLARYPGASTG